MRNSNLIDPLFVAALHAHDAPDGDVRLAYLDEPEIELGRVAGMDLARLKLATAMAAWALSKCEFVLAEVREMRRWWVLEVLR